MSLLLLGQDAGTGIAAVAGAINSDKHLVTSKSGVNATGADGTLARSATERQLFTARGLAGWLRFILPRLCMPPRALVDRALARSRETFRQVVAALVAQIIVGLPMLLARFSHHCRSLAAQCISSETQ